MLIYANFCNKKEFKDSFDDVKYSFNQLFGNFNIGDFKHLIIKPHGSLNIVFKTDNQNTPNKIHSIYFQDQNNYFATFDWMEIGYDVNNQNIITEKRPCLIGVLPDDMKDELNSPALFSDLAHDFCKWNMASTSFALEKASSIFILGYSMPLEDQWLWERFNNINKKDINIYVASRSKSVEIVSKLNINRFINSYVINCGKIEQ